MALISLTVFEPVTLTTDYRPCTEDETGEAAPTIEVNGWDGVRRYTIARKLYGFPMALIVGLSVDEQLAEAARLKRTYMWRAAGASVLLIAVIAWLGRLNWRRICDSSAGDHFRQ